MDIKKVREILGDKAESMTDEEVTKIRDEMSTLTDIMLDIFRSMTPEQRKNFANKIKKEKKIKNTLKE